ncbi:hypothetical protein FPH17_06765 [Corynebacterium godavarianum]|uniref:Uncharacterized protein n=2 Tax=Corynebacterium TaxID=1716 RepID=A0A269PGB7_9CORY|nr:MULTISPECIES: hypothetical protein [Corynebacterium]MBL7286451.1 hypothetical protein [Corynebacterium godavarianum]MCG7253901.1 hypothetical protein [Corynebacterium hadale]MCG7257355.1 hypothetical protein [Corynebacterium hadale]MCG7264612.1 hypothetical protein [Corynebacterium hadale]PAJ71112.1 hypothetical protein CIG21_02285 [Corynebacterium hadale]
MHKTAAMLRHRELTQEIYNIGDEVAEYIEHIAEAVADYDGELTDDCLAEFVEIADDARVDARRVVGELIGLRQALTSGMRAGVLSASACPEEKVPEPELLDATGLEELFPLSAPFSVQTMEDALTGRTDLTVQHLTEIVAYTLEQTDMVARELGAVSLPHLYATVSELVEAAVEGWVETVCVDHPAFVRTMRGTNPPEFLDERARINRIVEKVAAKRSRRGA